MPETYTVTLTREQLMAFHLARGLAEDAKQIAARALAKAEDAAEDAEHARNTTLEAHQTLNKLADLLPWPEG